MAVIEMVQHLWLAAALGVAAELGIADLLRNGSMSISELAEMTNTHEDSLYRLMRMLASHDIFREEKNRVFTLTSLAQALQEDHVKYYVTSHLSKLHFQMFSELKYSVSTGKNACELFINKPLFEHFGSDETHSRLFNKAMTNITKMQLEILIPAFSFKRFRNIVDVGGGQGLLITAICSRHPVCRGILFDLPHLTSQAKKTFEQNKLAPDRVEVISGSFFDKIPEGGDLYILKNILCDWDDESCRKILGNIGSVMTKTSRLLIIDSVIDEGNKPSFGKMNDILMMVSVGGKERTIAEFNNLLQHTGFRIKKLHNVVSSMKLIEGELA
jgi:predicted transcriptional regulator